MSKVEIEFRDGTVLDEEHLAALRPGETVELEGVVSIQFSNVTISSDALDENGEHA
jgi:hypothetical protein